MLRNRYKDFRESPAHSGQPSKKQSPANSGRNNRHVSEEAHLAVTRHGIVDREEVQFARRVAGQGGQQHITPHDDIALPETLLYRAAGQFGRIVLAAEMAQENV